MLHELLLALSGHASPLFSDSTTGIVSDLSAAELALLKQLAHLGTLQQEIHTIAAQILKHNHSTICRVVATSIISTQLEVFQQKILEIERSILSKDSTIVGAYDIVPLSGIAAAFAGWNRKLTWITETCELIHRNGFSGAQIINWLQIQSKTGFPDLETIVIEILTVAEKAWLKQLCTWILHGRLPSIGAGDFLIQQDAVSKDFRVEMTLAPAFVTATTGSSILFVGRSLNYIANSHSRQHGICAGNTLLLTEHMASLSALQHPLSSTSLARAVANIRSSLAKSTIQKLLPSATILQFLTVLQEFFLLSRGEFPIALVASADETLQTRTILTSRQHESHGLGSTVITVDEASAVLSRTWSNLAALQDIHEDEVDGTLEAARDLINLEVRKRSSLKHKDKTTEIGSLFDDALLSTPATLSINIAAPLDLFFTQQNATTYSTIFSYLLSIRRGHLHLTSLWKLSTLRRYRTTSPSGPHRLAMRSLWAAVSSATFFLTELGEYLQGEVVPESWSTLYYWLKKENEERDPEILTLAHQAYLASLVKSLILDDIAFAKALRALLTQCDQLGALVRRLEVIQQTLQNFEDPNGSNEAPTHLLQDQQEILAMLSITTQSTTTKTKDLITLINEIDTRNPEDEEPFSNACTAVAATFEPWNNSGVRSLLMRLDFRAMADD